MKAYNAITAVRNNPSRKRSTVKDVTEQGLFQKTADTRNHGQLMLHRQDMEMEEYISALMQPETKRRQLLMISLKTDVGAV